MNGAGSVATSLRTTITKLTTSLVAQASMSLTCLSGKYSLSMFSSFFSYLLFSYFCLVLYAFACTFTLTNFKMKMFTGFLAAGMNVGTMTKGALMSAALSA